jgi:hypothetical protein
MQDYSPVAATISKAVAESRTRTLTGSKLRLLVSSAHPEFNALNYSARNLRDFVRKFVPEVVEKGRAGADPVYGLLESIQSPVEQITLFDSTPKLQSHTPLDSLLTDPRVWKTFASPQSPWRLFWDRQTGLIRVVDPAKSDPVGPDWIQIPPCSADVLLQIGRDFAATVPEVFRSLLISAFQEKKWWLPFFDTLQAIGLRSKWVIYRRRRIIAEFERVITDLVREHPQSTTRADHPVRAEGQEDRRGISLPPGGAELTKKVAIAALSRMTDAELRALNLPLGYVLDALNTQ